MTPSQNDCIPEQFIFGQVNSCPVVVNFKGEPVNVFGVPENPRLLKLSQTIKYRASEEYSRKFQPIVEFFESLFPGTPDLKKDAAEFVDNSVWYCSVDYQTKNS